MSYLIQFFFINFHSFYKFSYFLYKHITDRKKILLLSEYIKPGMTVIDIGANIGFYTILLAKLVGKKGKVYAFEPDPTNFHFLKANTKGHKNILLYQVAVGDKNKEMKLYLSKNNVDHHTYKTEEKREEVTIPCIKLDTFFKDSKNIHFIKSDIQGYDYFAILGARNLIKRQKKLLIIGEFWPFGMKKAGIEGNVYIQLLEKLGISLTLQLPDKINTLENRKMYYTDYIGVK